MKKYRVHLHETICGDVEVEADTPQHAEYKAKRSADTDWDTSDSEVDVDSIKEVIVENGEEREIEIDEY